MTAHGGYFSLDTGTAAEPPLRQALNHSMEVKARVEDAALNLSEVNATLKSDSKIGVPRTNVQRALKKTEGVETVLREAATELVHINEELIKALTDCTNLAHRVRQGASALRASQSEARKSKAAEEAARHRASHDALTGLPNLTLYCDLLAQALEHADRRAWRLAVLFLDLNGFKEFNDSHGHDVGDRVLQEVAMRLRETVRGADSVARRGGDEFLILALEVQDDDTILVLANKLCARLGEPMDIDGTNVTVSASIGVAIYPEDAMSSAALLKAADDAMYVAKRRRTGVMRHAEMSERAES